MLFIIFGTSLDFFLYICIFCGIADILNYRKNNFIKKFFIA